MTRKTSRLIDSGFTLIELMVVVAVIGILAAVAIPAFMKNARKAKTAEATINVKKMYDGARSYYEEEMSAKTGVKVFPDSLGQLAEFGYIDPRLGSGESEGYGFELCTAADGQSFKLVAFPLFPGVSGDAFLFTDEQGPIETTPDPAAAQSDATLQQHALSTLDALNRLSGGAALGLATALVGSEKNVAAVLGTLGSSSPNGAPTGATLLGNVGPAIHLPQLHTGDDGRPEGDDAELAKLLEAYLARLRGILDPILVEPLGLLPPAGEASAATLRLLAAVKPIAPSEAVCRTEGLIALLSDADMTKDNPKAARAHRARLAESTSDACHAAQAGSNDIARSQLLWLRRLVDGDRSPPDWVAGPAAGRLLLQIDLGLGSLP